MPAIALSFLLLFQTPPVIEVLADVCSSLSAGNPAGALAAFDRKIPGYDQLQVNINALTAQSEMICSIDPIDQNGDIVDVDWFLMIRSKEENGPTERREERVKLTFAQTGKRWKITSLEPRSILNPPKL